MQPGRIVGPTTGYSSRTFLLGIQVTLLCHTFLPLCADPPTGPKQQELLMMGWDLQHFPVRGTLFFLCDLSQLLCYSDRKQNKTQSPECAKYPTSAWVFFIKHCQLALVQNRWGKWKFGRDVGSVAEAQIHPWVQPNRITYSPALGMEAVWGDSFTRRQMRAHSSCQRHYLLQSQPTLLLGKIFLVRPTRNYIRNNNEL